MSSISCYLRMSKKGQIKQNSMTLDDFSSLSSQQPEKIVSFDETQLREYILMDAYLLWNFGKLSTIHKVLMQMFDVK